MNILFAILSVTGTVGLFFSMLALYKKWSHAILLPVLTCTIIISSVLIIFQIPYNTYMLGGEWLQKLLGPAVVALAIPLYNQRELIFKYKVSIIVSIFVAMIAGLVSIVALLVLFKVSESFILAAIPKSITTPVAMEISSVIGGVAPLTAIFVMVAGFTGAIFGPLLYKVFKIDTAISRGVAMGSASHGVGVSKLNEYDEKTLSIGSLAMGLSAVIGSFICPLFVMLFI